MWKLAVALVAVLLGGCGPTYTAPEERTVVTAYQYIADRCSEAAGRINAERASPTDMIVKVVLVTEQTDDENAFPLESSGFTGLGEDRATTGTEGDRRVLYVGADATVDAVEEALREFTRCPLDRIACPIEY